MIKKLFSDFFKRCPSMKTNFVDYAIFKNGFGMNSSI